MVTDDLRPCVLQHKKLKYVTFSFNVLVFSLAVMRVENDNQYNMHGVGDIIVLKTTDSQT